MPLTRFEDWPNRLVAFLESRRNRSFEWGAHDCVLFALDSVAEITGVDAASDIRGKYSTQIGAAKRMKALYGHATLPEAAGAFAVRWGGEEIPPLLARRGDIVLHISENRVTLGVCLGVRFSAAGQSGLASVPMRLAERAWRV